MKKFLIKIYKKTIGRINNKRLKCKEITIISNNCWAGIFYRNNNLEYLSPTLGLFIMADDYIKFVYDIKKYINSKLEFIKIEESKYKDYLKKLNYSSPIGKIDDIEIMFLHYKDENEAYEKWERRKKRINWDKVVYKFSDQNMCTFEHIEKFNNLPVKNKILFTTRQYEGINSIVLEKYGKCENIGDDIKSYKKYFNVYNYLNNIK